MKKNLKNLLTNNKLTLLLFVSVLIPIIGSIFLPPIIFNVINLIILLFIAPLCLLLISNFSLPKDLSVLLLIIITTFFFVYIPSIFTIHQVFHISLPEMNLPIINSVIITLAIIKTILFPEKTHFSYHLSSKSNFLIFVIPLSVGIILHTLFFHFYIFIPETDSYSKILEINQAIDGTNISMNRGLFTTAMAIMTLGNLISPYDIFSIYFIFIQIFFIILSIYSILRYIHLPKTIKLLLLLSPYAIPVLNMEIDIVRPQNILILFLFIYSTLIFHLTKQKNTSIIWTLTTLIAVCGALYHELFFIILITHCILLFINYFSNSVKKQRLSLKRISWKSSLIIFIAIILLFLLSTKVPSFHIFIHMPLYVFNKISHISQWRLWFINSYGTNTAIGWSGISGTIKYYAYYTSPLILFLILYFILFFIKRWKYLEKKPLLITSFCLLFIPIVFAEILPRMNYFLYPERMWIFIDIILLLSFIMSAQSLLQLIQKKLHLHFVLLSYFLLIIGIIGSTYIATQKKAYTSKNEFLAAQWIKKNTPKDSSFVTQFGNGPMIIYFAQRNIISSNIALPLIERATKSQKCPILHLHILQHSLTTNTFQDSKPYTPLLIQNCVNSEYLKTFTPKNKHHCKQLINITNNSIASPKYILYSYDKFKGLYKQRKWWLKNNYYNTDIDAITKKYPLIYNENDIYIWKIK